MSFSHLRSLLFLLDPELSHNLSLKSMAYLHAMGMGGLYRQRAAQQKPCSVMGLDFPNRIGLAAGLDKNGDYIDALGDLGFGFIEIGTVTPKAQEGNPKPRLFRLPEHEAIINRMGFNNKGVDYLVRQAEKRRYSGVLGINIGKNKDTPLEDANQDYLFCLERVYACADYITVNLSSPNTPGLRALQVGDALSSLVHSLANKKAQLASIHQRKVPLLIKIAPDMQEDEISSVARTALECDLDGLIATNTTIDRDRVTGPYAQEAGGLSGRPVFRKSTETLEYLSSFLSSSEQKEQKGKKAKKLCLVGVGGISSSEEAKQKFEAGADLIQLYSGFIYQGPELVKTLIEQG